MRRLPACCWATVAAAAIGAAVVGCARTEVRTLPTLDADGTPRVEKRIDAHPQAVPWALGRRDAYRRPGAVPFPVPAAQREVVEQWGRPAWVRRFVSLAGERVEEWLYPEQQTVIQFVGDALVYEGPLTDVERVLLERGRPDRAVVQRTESLTIEVYIYNGLFSTRLEQYHFVNGRLTQFKENG